MYHTRCMTERFSAEVAQPTPSQDEKPPFRVECIRWTDEDFEREHENMRNIPCIRGSGVSRELRSTVAEWRGARKQHAELPGAVSRRVEAFDPSHVILRYAGDTWDHAFHQQDKYGTRPTSHQRAELESNVTGMAKKVAREIPRIVRGIVRDMKEVSSPEIRAQLEREVVQEVDDVLSTMYTHEATQQNVRVTKLLGPRGPVFFSEEGNHRLAAARLIGLRKVRGVVEAVADPRAALDEWYDVLVRLEPGALRQLTTLYDAMYPATEAQKRQERECIRAAIQRLPQKEDRLRAEHICFGNQQDRLTYIPMTPISLQPRDYGI